MVIHRKKKDNKKKRFQQVVALVVVVNLILCVIVGRNGTNQVMQVVGMETRTEKNMTTMASTMIVSTKTFVAASPNQNILPKSKKQWQQAILQDTSNFTIPLYFALWNYTTHSIHIPNKRPGDSLTSLEILETVLIDNDLGNITKTLPSCLVPNTKNTQALVDSGETIQLPVLNLGMPKCGSSTLKTFFKCAGLKATHLQDGLCMKDALKQGLPPLQGCKFSKKAQAILQMDSNHPNHCCFPQISFLDEIHREQPNATFVMNFRPVNDWIQSARNWNGMVNRWATCLDKIPGLQARSGKRLADKDLQNWLCGHVKHVREFVKQHPTHTLIELDLYDTEGTSKVLTSLFNANQSCWIHSNAKKTRPTNSNR